jgi:hypothetical protein
MVLLSYDLFSSLSQQDNTIENMVCKIQSSSIMQLHAEYILMPIRSPGFDLLADLSLSNNLIEDNNETP